MTEIVEVTAPDRRVDALLARHHAAMTAGSPAESCHVMTAEELRASGARLFAARDPDGTISAIGAFRPLSPTAVEVKSMHTASEARGRGLARRVLDHLLQAAREARAEEVLLETGTAPQFAPARALYVKTGFEPCPPFGGYRDDPLSTFMRLGL